MNFIPRLAENLGVSQETLEAAIQETQLEIVDELLANGTIDEEQAAEMRERIESGKGGRFFFGGPRAGHHLRGVVGQIAETLGVTGEELVAAWDGQTLAEAIVELGGNPDEVKAALLAQIETKLTEKGVDPERIAEVLANASEKIDRLLAQEGPPGPGDGAPSGFDAPLRDGAPVDPPVDAGLVF